jgi:hypothetical protein
MEVISKFKYLEKIKETGNKIEIGINSGSYC